MTPEKYQRLKPLFEQALDIPPAQRAEFILKVRLVDDELGRELESLVEQHTGDSDDVTRSIDTPLVRFDNLFPSAVPSFSAGEILLDRFRIVRFIDKGGMGEVYEAEDKHLGRIAVKTIRPHLASQPEMMTRFSREVQLSRRVGHTGVCRIHELFPFPAGEKRGAAALLTMEYLEGETLARRIERTGALSLAEAEAVSIQLCAGVQAIHDAGVLHRDIKCSNIMLASRNGTMQAVVMDLGLAREFGFGPDDDTGLTTPGAVMGTRAYMAPELLKGAPATAASDVFAIGVVLFEMVTGTLPPDVREGSPSPPASLIRRDLPAQWDVVIGRCRQYDREKRYQSAKEIAEALGAQASVSRTRVTATRISSIATRRWVLPVIAVVLVVALIALTGLNWWRIDNLRHPLPQKRFVALMSWPNVTSPEFMGLLKNVLATIDNRLAPAESSSRALLFISAADASAQTLLKQPSDAVQTLGANLVLAASLRSTGSGTVLELRVIEAASGKELRIRRVSSPLAQLKLLPQRASIAAAQLLDVSLQRSRNSERDEMADVPPAAFQNFNAAEDEASRPNDAGIQNAVEKYQRALELDPKFALAYARLSMSYIQVYKQSQDPAVLRLAGRNADLALRYNPDSVKSLLAKAAFDVHSGNTQNALEIFGQALQIEPGNPEILLYKARAFRDLGKATDEENVYREIIHERPNFWPAYNDLGSVLYRHASYKEAASVLAEGIAVAPRVALLLTNLGTMYMDQHDNQNAEINFQKSLAIAPNELSYLNLGSIAFEAGDYRKALDFYSKARDLKPASSLMWRNIADCHAMLGEPALARQNYAKAEDLLKVALQTNPRRGYNWMNLAYYESKLGEREQAEANIRKAEDLGATDLESRFMKAQTLAVLGKKSESLALVMDCVNQGFSVVEVELAVDLKDLRSDPAYRRFVSKTVTAP